MNKMKFLLLTILALTSFCNAAKKCGYTDDLLGECVNFSQCPIENKINLAFGKGYKTVQGCVKEQDVCCKVVHAVNSDECPGQCKPECPLGWTKKKPSYGDSVIGERNSDSGLCSSELDICCVSPEEVQQQFPWVATIMKKQEKLNRISSKTDIHCIGSIITVKVVLTAAHKLHDTKHDSYRYVVYAGNDDILRATAPGLQKINVDRIIVHEAFDVHTHSNNIALVLLKSSFYLNSYVQPIVLPTPSDVPDFDQECVVGSWNRQGSVKKVQTRPVQRAECETQLQESNLGSHFVLNDEVICASGKEGENINVGDGGAPLACPRKNNGTNFYQLGISSWGIKYKNSDIPRAFVDVTRYVNWIGEKINFDGPGIEEKIGRLRELIVE